MLDKKSFIEETRKLFEVHDYIPNNENMVALWYEECKRLNKEDYVIAVNRAFYSPKYPKLYDILVNLPNYDNDKSINDYCNRMKEIELKKSKAVKFDAAAYIKKLEES